MVITQFQNALSEVLFWTEGLSAIIALWYYKSVKNQYWKYFFYYLLIVFSLELFGRYVGNWALYSKVNFYNYLVIPFQFIFFYWLYASKSFKNKKLFWIFSLLYIVSFFLSEIYFKESKIFFSLNYTFGCCLLMILVVMEYYQQINSNDILIFQKNRMFYINLGVTIFYIGTLPFLTFYPFLVKDVEIWNIYYNYFLISDILMYLLFSISFIWGKQNF